jgi:hypothetical protein
MFDPAPWRFSGGRRIGADAASVRTPHRLTRVYDGMKDASMRTTIDLPDDLYRTLKARAAFGGTTLRALILQLVEQGLRQPTTRKRSVRREPPRVIIKPRGVPIEPLSASELRRLEEEGDEARHARPA